LAEQLGSDVPMFLGPATARITGRGQHVANLVVGEFLTVLLVPDFACSTAAVYRALDRSPQQMGRALAENLLAGPPSRWRAQLANHLAAAAETVQPELRQLRDALQHHSPLPVCLTGSGSGMFILCDDRREAAAALSQMPSDLRRKCLVVEKNAW
jgi:4-diphosphocytidyl-2C-methyl-D-erythritol kinase